MYEIPNEVFMVVTQRYPTEPSHWAIPMLRDQLSNRMPTSIVFSLYNYMTIILQLLGQTLASITPHGIAVLRINSMRFCELLQAGYCLESDAMLDMVTTEFDMILALSVTKWIHLHHGRWKVLDKFSYVNFVIFGSLHIIELLKGLSHSRW